MNERGNALSVLPDDPRFASYAGFFNIKKTPQLRVLINLPHKIVGIFSGNQGGKSLSVAYQYFLRVIGAHPVKDKNRLAKKIRCMSSTLPGSKESDEQDNTQYLELKKLIPYEMIRGDISTRSSSMVVSSPTHGKTVFEFRSSKQELQDLGKIQLSSVWHDEETPESIRNECKVRLLVEDGDEYFSLTPINPLSYCFDQIWEKASFIYRTSTIQKKFGLPEVEHRKTGYDIGDDNPILTKDSIERLFSETNPDELNLRRYGVFRATSGRIHKTYDPRVCYISFQKTFPDGVPSKDWTHARGVDFHESRTPWSVGWLACSPQNEWFLWQEFHPAIDGPNAYNTYEIVKSIVRKSMDYDYVVNLIDPLAGKKQPNTLFSTIDDLNRHFSEMRVRTFWQPWDTKGTTGRDEVAKRFKNAVKCGKPFANAYKENGALKYLPTLWICDTCPKTNESLIKWRFGEYIMAAAKAVNDPKPTPQQKHSHNNMVLECLAKDHRLVYACHFWQNKPSQLKPKHISVAGRVSYGR